MQPSVLDAPNHPLYRSRVLALLDAIESPKAHRAVFTWLSEDGELLDVVDRANRLTDPAGGGLVNLLSVAVQSEDLKARCKQFLRPLAVLDAYGVQQLDLYLSFNLFRGQNPETVAETLRFLTAPTQSPLGSADSAALVSRDLAEIVHERLLSPSTIRGLGHLLAHKGTDNGASREALLAYLAGASGSVRKKICLAFDQPAGTDVGPIVEYFLGHKLPPALELDVAPGFEFQSLSPARGFGLMLTGCQGDEKMREGFLSFAHGSGHPSSFFYLLDAAKCEDVPFLVSLFADPEITVRAECDDIDADLNPAIALRNSAAAQLKETTEGRLSRLAALLASGRAEHRRPALHAVMTMLAPGGAAATLFETSTGARNAVGWACQTQTRATIDRIVDHLATGAATALSVLHNIYRTATLSTVGALTQGWGLCVGHTNSGERDEVLSWLSTQERFRQSALLIALARHAAHPTDVGKVIAFLAAQIRRINSNGVTALDTRLRLLAQRPWYDHRDTILPGLLTRLAAHTATTRDAERVMSWVQTLDDPHIASFYFLLSDCDRQRTPSMVSFLDACPPNLRANLLEVARLINTDQSTGLTRLLTHSDQASLALIDRLPQLKQDQQAAVCALFTNDNSAVRQGISAVLDGLTDTRRLKFLAALGVWHRKLTAAPVKGLFKSEATFNFETSMWSRALPQQQALIRGLATFLSQAATTQDCSRRDAIVDGVTAALTTGQNAVFYHVGHQSAAIACEAARRLVSRVELSVTPAPANGFFAAARQLIFAAPPPPPTLPSIPAADHWAVYGRASRALLDLSAPVITDQTEDAVTVMREKLSKNEAKVALVTISSMPEATMRTTEFTVPVALDVRDFTAPRESDPTESLQSRAARAAFESPRPTVRNRDEEPTHSELLNRHCVELRTRSEELIEAVTTNDLDAVPAAAARVSQLLTAEVGEPTARVSLLDNPIRAGFQAAGAKSTAFNRGL